MTDADATTLINECEQELRNEWMRDDRHLWRAVLTLASILPSRAVVDGSQCWEAVRDFFSPPELRAA